MTALETDVTAGNFAGYARRAEPTLGPRPKRRHDRALFIEGRTSCPLDVSTKSVEGGEATERRAVVQRSYLQGWTTAQIAADLGIADGTVKSRLHYALRALRRALREMGVTP
jgi:hypothetical protein